MKTAAWELTGDNDAIRTLTYSFGPGVARSFAVRGPKGWVVVSPACKPTEAQFAALEESAPIAALVAPNAFHYLGIEAWKNHAPNAKIFAPAQSIARIQKKTGRVDLASVAEAAEYCGSDLVLDDMPHYKTGEVLTRVRDERGPIWHVTDVIFNWPSLPPSLLIKFLFSVLTDSAPGFKLSGPAAFLMMRDKKALYHWLKEETQKAPPVRIVPSHGGDVMLDPPGQQLLDLLATKGI